MAMTSIATSDPDTAREADRLAAIVTLSCAAECHPRLRRAERSARLDLAAAITAMDEAERTTATSLAEQAAVEMALHAYGQALADLLRGDTSAADTEENQR